MLVIKTLFVIVNHNFPMSLARSQYIQKMRAKCLLESYYGERMSTATAQCFSDCLTSDEFTWHACKTLQQLESFHQTGALPNTNCVQGAECPDGLMRDDLLQLIRDQERHININLENARQMQAIRAIGVDLRRAADHMQIRPARSILDVNRAAMLQEGLSNEELQVVRRIYAETASTTLSNIARHLKECLTSQTFRMALVFLSSSTSSVSEELAATCELVRLIYPTVQEAIQAGPIYDQFQEFIEAKLDEVLH